jgi:hypothetical protein
MNEERSLDSLIEDIEQTAQAGGLLSPRTAIRGDNLLIIEDFEQAKDYAWHRFISDDENAPNWTDLRAEEVARLLGATYDDPSLASVRASIRATGQRFADEIVLPPVFEAAFEDITADLQHVALSRVVMKAPPGLFTQMWDVYRQGGWPCGWEGSYPDGRLVVFQPAVDHPRSTAADSSE